MGNVLGSEESGVIILGSLGGICLFSKRWVRSSSIDNKKVIRLLTKSTINFLDGMQVFDFYLFNH